MPVPVRRGELHHRPDHRRRRGLERVSKPGSTGAGDIEVHNPFVGNRLGFDGLPAVNRSRHRGSGHRGGLRGRPQAPLPPPVAPPLLLLAGNAGTRPTASAGSPSSASTRGSRPTMPGPPRATCRWPGPTATAPAYGADWLIHNSYDTADRARRSAWRPVLWRSELAEDFPTVAWSRAGGSDSGRLEMYRLLRDFGVVRVGGLGADPGGTEALASLLGAHPRDHRLRPHLRRPGRAGLQAGGEDGYVPGPPHR